MDTAQMALTLYK